MHKQTGKKNELIHSKRKKYNWNSLLTSCKYMWRANEEKKAKYCWKRIVMLYKCIRRANENNEKVYTK